MFKLFGRNAHATNHVQPIPSSGTEEARQFVHDFFKSQIRDGRVRPRSRPHADTWALDELIWMASNDYIDPQGRPAPSDVEFAYAIGRAHALGAPDAVAIPPRKLNWGVDRQVEQIEVEQVEVRPPSPVTLGAKEINRDILNWVVEHRDNHDGVLPSVRQVMDQFPGLHRSTAKLYRRRGKPADIPADKPRLSLVR